jgi:hypothetical protein
MIFKMGPSDKHSGRDSQGLPSVWSEAVRQPALAQLSRILESPQFRSSKRCSQFLRYVVERASQNHLEGLKERALGIEVFERDPQYDTNQDPVVRTTAGEVRKRLAQYYLEPGHEEEPRISLPAGSYVPDIHMPAAKLESVAASRPGIRMRWVYVAAGITIATTAILLLFIFRKTDLDRFWAPVLEPQENVLVCIGQPRTYNFNSKAQHELEKWFESGAAGADGADAKASTAATDGLNVADGTDVANSANSAGKQNPPPELANLSLVDVVPMWDRYVGLGDAQAFSELANLFSRKGNNAQLRGVRSVSLSDLRSKPCVLIGAFNNEWTMSLAGELRFYFDIDYRNSAEFVSDRQNPGKTEWKVVNSWPHWKIPADYAIVSRVFNPTTEQTVVIAAGITHYGTHAAGEFLTNQAYFSEAVRHAPRDWYRKNMQVVLSTKVISGANGPPKVLAVHFW